MKAQTQKYIKSFSHGQITVPKEFREELGLGDEFWLKLYIDQNKIVGEPVGPKITLKSYREKLLKLDTSWFSEKKWQAESKKIREEIKRRLINNEK